MYSPAVKINLMLFAADPICLIVRLVSIRSSYMSIRKSIRLRCCVLQWGGGGGSEGCQKIRTTSMRVFWVSLGSISIYSS